VLRYHVCCAAVDEISYVMPHPSLRSFRIPFHPSNEELHFCPDLCEGSTSDEEEFDRHEAEASPSVQHSDSKPPGGRSGGTSGSCTGQSPEKVDRRIEDSAQQLMDLRTQLRELQRRLEAESAARETLVAEKAELRAENAELRAELRAAQKQSIMDRLTAEGLEAYLTEQEEENDALRTELEETLDEADVHHTELLNAQYGARMEIDREIQRERDKCRAIIEQERARLPTSWSAAQLTRRAAEAAAAMPGAVVLDERLGYSTHLVRLPECGTELLVPRTPHGQRPAVAAAVVPAEVALLTLNVDGCVSAPKESRPLKVRRVAELAKKHWAGLVVLQEATAEYDALLREALPTGWGVASAATGTKTKRGVQEFAVFAWDPTVVARLHEPPSALRALESSFRRPPVVAHFALQNGGSLLMASVHAAPEQDVAKEEAAALGAEMLPLLRDRYGEPVLRTLVVCGDFNLAPPGELLEPNSGRAFGGLREMGWLPTNKQPTNQTVLLKDSAQERVYDNVFVHRSVHQALVHDQDCCWCIDCPQSGDKTAEVLKFDEIVLEDWRRATGGTRATSRLTKEWEAFERYLKGEYAKLKDTDPETIEKTKMRIYWLSHGLGYSDHRGLLLRIPAAALRHEANERMTTTVDATTPSGKSRAMRALVEAMSTAVVHAVEDRAARVEHAQDAQRRQEHLEAKFADKPQCQGRTRKGQRCKNPAANDDGFYDGFCSTHKEQIYDLTPPVRIRCHGRIRNGPKKGQPCPLTLVSRDGSFTYCGQERLDNRRDCCDHSPESDCNCEPELVAVDIAARKKKRAEEDRRARALAASGPLCKSYIQVDHCRPDARGALTTMRGLHFELCSNPATTDDHQFCQQHAVDHTDCVLSYV
jgi:hypothetical protein